MASTTRTQIPAEVNNFYDRTLLERAVSNFVHTRWAQIRDIPRKSGTKTIKFRRYGNLTAALTPLSEGITPTGSQLSVTDITATVAQYGDYITVTDVVSYESKDAVLMEASEILGDQAGDTIDQLTRDILAAGTNVYYGGVRTARGDITATDIVSAVLMKKVVRLFGNNKAKKMTRMVNPSDGYNTTPLNACYIAICSPSVTYDLKGVTGFIPVQKYPNQSNVMEGEVGSLEDVRFVESPNAKVFTGEGAGGVDVHTILVLAANAYGITRISGEAMKNIVKPLGSAGTADPLDQRATSGWKATFVARILNDDYVTRVEVGVTA